MQNQLVSIITPAYNASKYIAETISSVQNQTYTTWELIIVDDGSTDNTSEVIKPFLKDTRIKYFYQTNGKQGKARNHAIKQAKGTYIAFIDADDLWANNKLEQQVLLMTNDPKIDIVYSQGYLFSENKESGLKKIEAPIGLQNNSDFLLKMLNQNQIPILSVLAKTEVVLNNESFNEDARIQNAEDYQLWVKLIDSGAIFYGMKEQLFYYRIHPNQSTSNFSETIVPKIWALNSISYKSISKNEVIHIMESKLDSFLMKYIDNWSKKKLTEIIDLYHLPLSSYKKYLAYKFSFLFGKMFLKKICYRFSYVN